LIRSGNATMDDYFVLIENYDDLNFTLFDVGELDYFDVELPEIKSLEEIIDELAEFDVDLPDFKSLEDTIDGLASEDDID